MPVLIQMLTSLELIRRKAYLIPNVVPSNLRKTLFQVMDALIKNKPQDDPVYAFIDKKRTEGKPYYVYMTAGANRDYEKISVN